LACTPARPPAFFFFLRWFALRSCMHLAKVGVI
jgi:hypothetical protein